MKFANTYSSPPAPGLSRAEAAAYCGVCVRTLDQRRAEGDGPDYFCIGSVVRYWPAALDRYLDERPALKAKAIAMRRAFRYAFDPHLELVPTPDQILLPHEASVCLGVSKRTLNYWRAWGCGPQYTVIGKDIRYTGPAIRAYIKFEEHQLAD